jgi:hypothetical protein
MQQAFIYGLKDSGINWRHSWCCRNIDWVRLRRSCHSSTPSSNSREASLNFQLKRPNLLLRIMCRRFENRSREAQNYLRSLAYLKIQLSNVCLSHKSWQKGSNLRRHFSVFNVSKSVQLLAKLWHTCLVSTIGWGTSCWNASSATKVKFLDVRVTYPSYLSIQASLTTFGFRLYLTYRLYWYFKPLSSRSMKWRALRCPESRLLQSQHHIKVI